MPDEHQGEFGYGDVWTWTAIDADTKLVPSWYVGDKSSYSAKMLVDDLAFRMTGRIQLTTDGNHAYVEPVEQAFGGEIDYGMLIKPG